MLSLNRLELNFNNTTLIKDEDLSSDTTAASINSYHTIDHEPKTKNHHRLLRQNGLLFKDLSITLLPGSITYLLGPNGCGKTSLLRIIGGIQQPTSGAITFGRTAIPIDELAKPYCLYIGHHTAIKLELSVFENIEFWAEIYGAEHTVNAAVNYFDLEEILGKKCYQLSAGNRKKVALTRLLTCPAKIWLLDEIEANLDPGNQEKLKNLLLSKANSGGIVICTSHNKPIIDNVKFLNLKEYTA